MVTRKETTNALVCLHQETEHHLKGHKFAQFVNFGGILVKFFANLKINSHFFGLLPLRVSCCLFVFVRFGGVTVQFVFVRSLLASVRFAWISCSHRTWVGSYQIRAKNNVWESRQTGQLPDLTPLDTGVMWTVRVMHDFCLENYQKLLRTAAHDFLPNSGVTNKIFSCSSRGPAEALCHLIKLALIFFLQKFHSAKEERKRHHIFIY